MRHCLGGADGRSATEAVELLQSSVRALAGSAPQPDDLSFLVVRRTG